MNKKRIFGVALFMILALFTYTFASPNKKVEEPKNEQQEVKENEQEENNTPSVETPVVNPVITPVVAPTPVVNQVITPVVTTEQPATIVNNPIVNDNEEEIIDLTNAKNNAKEELRNYADIKELGEDYTETLEKIVTDGNTAIDNSTNEENINKALEDAKELIDELADKADLDNHKKNLIEELNTYYDELEFTDSEDEESDSKTILNDGIKNINDSTDKTSADKALEYAKKALDAEKTKQDLAKAKTDAETALNAYHDELFGEGNEASQKVLNDGIKAINDSETIEDVNTALEDAKKALDAEKAKQDLAKAKTDAIKELKEYKTSLEFTEEFLTKENGANAIETNGINNINNSETVENVNMELQKAKDLLYSLKEELMKPATLSLKGNDNIVLTRSFLCKYNDEGINVTSNSSYDIKTTTKFTRPYSTNSTITDGINVDCSTSLIPLDIPKAGTYEITYTVTNVYGKQSTITRTVKIGRFTDKIFAGKDLSIEYNIFNNTYNACRTQYCSAPVISEAKAYDYVDGKSFDATNITDRMTINSNVDTTKIDTYNINYQVTDWLGQTKSTNRTIEIKDLENPTINFSGTKMVQCGKKSVNIDKVSSVTDNYDENINLNNVNEKYKRIWNKCYVTYTVKDSQGNKTEVEKKYDV